VVAIGSNAVSFSLGDPLPASFSPLYKGQLLVHGMKKASCGERPT
jgi:hypothetical protein